VEAEVILGCRRTTGTGEGKSNWGIDLYGNERLFVDFDQETFSSMIPIRGGAKNLIRGLVNLRGPNVFIPWDTHKRHLNPDREIMRVLTKHPTIREFFARLVDPEAVADLTQRLRVPAGCGEPAGSTVRVVNAFLDRMQSSLYELCRVSNDVSRGAAANTYLLARIAGATGDPIPNAMDKHHEIDKLHAVSAHTDPRTGRPRETELIAFV